MQMYTVRSVWRKDGIAEVCSEERARELASSLHKMDIPCVIRLGEHTDEKPGYDSWVALTGEGATQGKKLNFDIRI